ncbi:alpha/beta fold hydrolase [Aspergillus saccharolyticus JOP 1030-1]|uniref:Alpha/beta-hydrolase n=1 Tax=Aspergillus saccharolyticus JOP 1030-1 TaxID=1450539 RepID=A0A318ZQF9_9EURO|nr:alpha/beta-hydrolase [Aspergillus saccharolyticus JOP 1030-1]PYH49851.1 alpha/beta-hydrolase [Aspergillus saccharolyticus JOP 1030-1]
MSSTNRPVIVIVPGAFGTPQGFEKLFPDLSQAGYTTHPGAYPSCNPSDPATVSAAQDIAFLRDNVLLPLLDQEGKDIVILAHSYGGVVGGGAARGLAKGTRSAEGKSTGVLGLIYVAGNITLEGESLFIAVGGAYPPFIKVDTPSQGLAVIEPAMEVLYNDCDRALAPELDPMMQPHALRAFETPATAPAWAESAFDGRRAYVRTLDDCCNPASLQDLWLAKSKVEWEVVDFKTGHMPFVSQPQALAEQIIKFVEGFVAK